MENCHFGFLGGARNARLGSGAVGHQAVVEEVSKIPILAETTCSEIFEIVNVEVTCKVAVGKVWRQKQKVLLLGYFVCFLLVAGFGVLLEVCVLVSFKTRAHVDQVSVVDWSSHPGTYVSPFGMVSFQNDDVHDLPDQGTAEELDVHPPDPSLGFSCDIFGFFV